MTSIKEQEFSRKQATQWLMQRYEEQCDKFPRTREIPLALYIRRNVADAMRISRLPAAA